MTPASRSRQVDRGACPTAGALPGRPDAGHIRHFTHWAYNDFAGKRGAMDFWSAVSGLEQALWDLAGKRLGVPVVSLLGGPCRERIRVYANGWYSGAKSPDAYAAKAKETVARGFTALKFDPFPGPWRACSSPSIPSGMKSRCRRATWAPWPSADARSGCRSS